MKPTVGRIVHFKEEGGPYPAIVTKVNEDGTVELTTFGPNSVYFQHAVLQDERAEIEHTWRWPPKE